jgi:hypothetical protein
MTTRARVYLSPANVALDGAFPPSADDVLVKCDSALGSFNINLVDALANEGRTFSFYNVPSSGNGYTVTIIAKPGQLINGTLTQITLLPDNSFSLDTDGAGGWLATDTTGGAATNWDISMVAVEEGGNLEAINGSIDVALSTRASEATLASILAGITARLDVALSTRSSEATLAAVLAQLVARLDVALSTRLKPADTLAALGQVNTPVQIAASDTPIIDAFGRLRMSQPVTLFDSKQIFDDSDLAANVENDPLFFDNVEFSGSGTSTLYDNNKASTKLSVSNATAGVRIRQTKLRFNYQPGKSMMVIMSFLFGAQATGITRREGYFDANNGIFLEGNPSDYRFVVRSKVTGSVSDAIYAKQSDWNIDTMDGNGPSGIALDFEKTQLFFLDFEWLGVGRCRLGFVVSGLIYYAHQFLFTNTLSTVYMSTPNLPLRSELTNDGTGAAASMEQICSTVISEGGMDKLGIYRSASTDGTAVTAASTGTIYAVVGLRKKSNYIGCSVEIDSVSLQIQTASEKLEWMLLLNPTVASTFTYADISRSACQYAKGATANTVTNGLKIAGGYLDSVGASSGASGHLHASVQSALRLGTTISGVRDEIVLCVRPVSSSTGVEVEGSIDWHEAV